MTTATKRWRVVFSPSPLLPGAMRYCRYENRRAGMNTVSAAELRRLQAYWRERYGVPVETVEGSKTVWEFVPVAGVRFDLRPPAEWGHRVMGAEFAEWKDCEG